MLVVVLGAEGSVDFRVLALLNLALTGLTVLAAAPMTAVVWRPTTWQASPGFAERVGPGLSAART